VPIASPAATPTAALDYLYESTDDTEEDGEIDPGTIDWLLANAWK
jgi:hypothetical protein